MIKAIWRYKDFVWGMVKREFELKYLGSVLGALWAVINPLTMVFIYIVIFSQVMRAKLPGVDSSMAYGVYLCSGLLPWLFFTDMVSRGQGMFIEFGNFLKKVNFPRSSLPLVVLLSAAINFSIIFVIFLLFLLFSGQFPGRVVFAMVPLLLLQTAFMVGMSVLIGTLNVFIRDTGQFMGVALQLWFWFTPIVYPASILPLKIVNILSLNPMFPLIRAYQDIFLYQAWPKWHTLLPLACVSVLLVLLSLLTFRKLSGEMVDEL